MEAAEEAVKVCKQAMIDANDESCRAMYSAIQKDCEKHIKMLDEDKARDDISNMSVSNISSNNQEIDNDAFLALQSLGFSPQSINQTIGKIIAKNKNLSTQEIIKKALELLK